jgi:hypothetical protein
MDKKKKPIKFKVVKPKPKPTPQMEEKKKKIKFKVVKIADRKLDELKKKAEEQTKKDGIKRRVLPTGEVQRKKTKPAPEQKPKPVSELQRVAGVNKEQANKMDTAELFGKLPVELRKMILDPKQTGIKVGMTPPLPKDLAKELDNVIDEIKNTIGFLDFFDGWTYYEGGNFKKGTHEYFENKAKQLQKERYDEIIDNLFEKYKKLPAVIKSTIRQYNMNSDNISLLIDRGEAPIFNDDYKYNNEYEDYNIEYRYGLSMEDDGDYYTTNQTKSSVNGLVKEVKEELKNGKKNAKDVTKRIEKFMKENKLD